MYTSTTFLAFLLVGLLFSSIQGDKVINLQRWQYCAGCRATVEAFASRVFPIINEALEGRGETETMNLAPYTEGICQTDAFRHYKEFVEHGIVYCAMMMSTFELHLFTLTLRVMNVLSF
jgi:hypothetical protein